MFPAPDSVWTDRVRDMRRAGMNMVRVWAGGIYPPDAFFAACDTAGILVWQDLMFAHIPPAEGGFPDNVRAEVRDQAARLSRWPGLVLWCGNNELEVAWDNWGWQERYGLHGADSARVRRGMDDLFLHLLPEALSAAHGAPYTPTSPLSNWGNADGLRHGDLHYWGVWHGDSAFSSFDGNTGRFVSEYGFQSWPDSATLADQIAPEHLVLGDPVLTARQRSYKTDRPILEAIEREFAVRPRHLGELCLFSQLAQAEACRRAIWAHISAQPRCMGTLFWQLNDVWAGPSWSTVDHLGTWKAAMYEVARSYRTLVMDLRRSGEAVTAHIRSEGAEPADACLVVQVFDVGGRRLRNDSIAVTLGPEDQEVLHLQTTEALAGSPPERRIVRTALVAGKGQVLAERFLPMARLGEMAWEPARVTMVADPGRAGRYRLSTDKPVAVVRIEAPGAEIGDNYFPLVPGADREVDISGGSGPPRLSTWPW